MTKEEAIEHVAKLAEKADNLLAATALPVPDSLHIQGLKGGLQQMSVELRVCYVAMTGENPWAESGKG